MDAEHVAFSCHVTYICRNILVSEYFLFNQNVRERS